MSAIEWLEEGATSAEDFNTYNGRVTLVNLGGLPYVQVENFGSGEDWTESLKSKEILRMAHWIIKEFG